MLVERTVRPITSPRMACTRYPGTSFVVTMITGAILPLARASGANAGARVSPKGVPV